jgi:hypothetical protein
MPKSKPKKLKKKEAIKLGFDIINRLKAARTNRLRVETLAQKRVDKIELEQKLFQAVCPHPKKFFSQGGFEYLNEHCYLCGYDAWF